MGNTTRLVTIIFVISIIIYAVTSAGNTAYNHFTLLADSFIHGKIYIEGQMPWLEKIPIDENRFFVANPPMPAIVAVIPVLVFGKQLPQQYLSFIIGSIIVTITFLISSLIKKDIKLAIWSSLLIGFGTINWYLTSVGSTWYLAQITAEMFLLVAIYLLLKNKNPFYIGLFLGFAYFSRIPVILTLPFFAFNLSKPTIKNLLLLAIGIIPSIILNFTYNYARFGVIWDIGYTMIPGVSSEPWYQKGVIHPSYILDHLKIIFTSLPKISSDYPYIMPSLFGYAIWFTTPAFIFALKNKFNEKIVWSAWFSILLVSLLIFSHGSTGFTQFGYRFAVDFYPVLIFLVIKGVSKYKKVYWYHWLFLAMGIIVNFWGVYFLNIFK